MAQWNLNKKNMHIYDALLHTKHVRTYSEGFTLLPNGRQKKNKRRILGVKIQMNPCREKYSRFSN